MTNAKRSHTMTLPPISMHSYDYFAVLEGLAEAFSLSHEDLEEDEFMTMRQWHEHACYKYIEALDGADNGHRVSDEVNRSVERAIKRKNARTRARTLRVQSRHDDR